MKRIKIYIPKLYNNFSSIKGGSLESISTLDKVLKLNLIDTNNWNKTYHKLWDDDQSVEILSDIIELYQQKPYRKVYADKQIFNNNAKVHIIGDIHSSLSSFQTILTDLNNKNIIDANLKLDSKNYIIFLGDIVDRGPYSIELLLIISKLKIINPNNVFIIDGNHEDKKLYDHYHLSEEIKEEDTNNKIGSLIHRFLNYLPSVMFIKYKDDKKWFQLCHGGIDYDIFKSNVNVVEDPSQLNKLTYHRNGFKWSDFNKILEIPKIRIGRGYAFGPEDTKKYLDNNNLFSIISGHQDHVNLGLLLTREKTLPEFEDCEKYNLSCPTDQKCKTIKLNPTKDFLALVTSTAKESRKLPCSAYLTLSKNTEHLLTVTQI
jgi:predicted MPP superfamily phosphohydrolase